jgi:hypothetical protein
MEPKIYILLLVKRQIQKTFERLTTQNFIASQFKLLIYLQNLHKTRKMSKIEIEFWKKILSKILNKGVQCEKKNQIFDFVKEKGLSKKQKNHAFTTKIDHYTI